MASQAGRRAKNKLNLKLNVNVEKIENKKVLPINKIEKIANMPINDTQRTKLMSFIETKGKIGELKISDFERIGEIGHGSHGVVFQVKHLPTDLIMAQKSIRLEVKQEVCLQILRELMVLHECSSPYIVGYYGAFHNEGEIFMLMEYMNRGSLDAIVKILKRIPENIIGRIIHDVIEGLAYLRKNHQVIHRDVKPSNILLNSCGEIKICDFGVSGKLIDSMANSFVGTRSYMAPERLKGAKYTVRSDVWSLGVLIMELLIGRYPYPQISEQKMALIMKASVDSNENEQFLEENFSIFELLDYIVNDEPPVLSETFFDIQTCDFAAQCLKKDPVERADLDQLLLHPYMTKYENFNISSWINNVYDPLKP